MGQLEAKAVQIIIHSSQICKCALDHLYPDVTPSSESLQRLGSLLKWMTSEYRCDNHREIEVRFADRLLPVAISTPTHRIDFRYNNNQQPNAITISTGEELAQRIANSLYSKCKQYGDRIIIVYDGFPEFMLWEVMETEHYVESKFGQGADAK